MAQRITNNDAVGLRAWKDESGDFLRAQFPNVVIGLGFTSVNQSLTLAAKVPYPRHYPEEDIRAAFELLGITQYQFFGGPIEAQ